jgi:hypothetical protein
LQAIARNKLIDPIRPSRRWSAICRQKLASPTVDLCRGSCMKEVEMQGGSYDGGADAGQPALGGGLGGSGRHQEPGAGSAGMAGGSEGLAGGRGMTDAGIAFGSATHEEVSRSAGELARSARLVSSRVSDLANRLAQPDSSRRAFAPVEPESAALRWVRANPLAILGLGFGAGLFLALRREEGARRRMTRLLEETAAVATATGTAILLEKLLRPAHPRPGTRTTAEPATPAPAAVAEPTARTLAGLEWLITAEEAAAFTALEPKEAASRAAALWERITVESPLPEELARAGDVVARLVDAHPHLLEPDVVRLFGVWPVLASADETVGAQVAWMAGRAGVQRVLRAMGPALREPGTARAIAEAFVKAVLNYGPGSLPPLSFGVPVPPSTVYPNFPGGGGRGGTPPTGGPPSGGGSGGESGGGSPDGGGDSPGRVHLGAAVPQAVRPRNRFLAYFVAYHTAFAADVQAELVQIHEMHPEDVRPPKRRVDWRGGTRIVVVPTSEALTFDPPRAEFTWDERYAIREFACTVRDDAPLGSALIEFQVSAAVPEGAFFQFDVVRVSIGIVEDAPVRTHRMVSTPVRATAFASYTSEDRELVSYKLSPIRALGVEVYDWRLEAREGDFLRATLESAIRNHDLFFLFWSSRTRASEWVRWELGVALDGEKRGRPRVIPQLLEKIEEKEDLPAELDGRQMLSPFYFLDPPERIRDLVELVEMGREPPSPRVVYVDPSEDKRAAPDGPDGPGGVSVEAAGD